MSTIPSAGFNKIQMQAFQPLYIRVTGVEHSRRFLRELDEAPEENNLQYIYYSVLVSLLLQSLVTRV